MEVLEDISDSQRTVRRQQRRDQARPVHYPAMRFQALTAGDAALGNPRLDGAPAQHPSDMRDVGYAA